MVLFSWLTGGMRRISPPEARAGMPLNSCQRAACARIHGLVTVCFREPSTFSARAQFKLEALYGLAGQLTACKPGEVVSPPPSSTAHAFDAQRARYLEQPLHFDPTPFLPFFEAAAYVEPRILQRPSQSPLTS